VKRTRSTRLSGTIAIILIIAVLGTVTLRLVIDLVLRWRGIEPADPSARSAGFRDVIDRLAGWWRGRSSR
jgi:hypothetical protein